MWDKIFRINVVFWFIYLGFLSNLIAQNLSHELDKPLNRGVIKPSIVHLETNTQQQFQIIMEASRLRGAFNPENIKWSVNGIVGGNEHLGTITPEGLYTAPSNVVNSHEIYVTGSVDLADNPLITATVLLNGIRPEYNSTVYAFDNSEKSSLLSLEPTAITIEENGNYLITTEELIMRYSREGKFIESFGEFGEDQEGYLLDPLNIALDKSGNIFISDMKITAPRIMAFNQQGGHLFSFGEKGYHPGMSFYTRGLVFNSKNRMYLGDVELSRINVFDNSGNYLFNFGKGGANTGEFNGYYDIAIDNNEDVFIANYFGSSQKFDEYGRYIFSFAMPDPPHGIIHTTDIATDSWGNVFIAVQGEKNLDGSFNEVKDSSGNRIDIVKYNNNGDFITNIQFSNEDRNPIRILVDNEDRLVVFFKSDQMVGVELLTKMN